ncbi:hypothetical protein ACWATR_03675 [Nostoc sp. UIC 10890]
MIEEEFRSQNGLNAPLSLTGVRIKTRRSMTRFPQRYQSGIQTGAGIVAPPT